MADTTGPLTSAAWTQVHRRLRAELDGLTDVVVARLRAELAGYAAVPAAALRPDVHDNLRRSLVVLEHGGCPSADELRAAGAVGAVRAGQGIPIDDVLRAWRIAGHELWVLQRQVADELGIDESEQLAATRLILEGIDRGLTAAAAAHRAARDRADTEVQQRVRLLRGLVLGTSTAADLDLLASGYRIDPDAAYRAIRCRPTGDCEARAVQRALAATGVGLAERVDDEILGVVPASAVPQVALPTGLGDPARPAELRRSFAEAAVALTTAAAFGMDGAVGLDQLGVRAAVATRAEIGMRLAARFVAPLLVTAQGGADTLHTVAEHLRGGLRVNHTARALYIHPNTVRHRLRRFEQLTGAQLDSIEDVMAVWWALRHHELHAP